MLTLALKESLQVACNPAFTTPDQENILRGHGVEFLVVLDLMFLLIAEKTSVESVRLRSRGVAFIMQGTRRANQLRV